MVISLLLLVAAQVPAPECITASGKRVCGYDCKASAGIAACAQTSLGVCVVAGVAGVTCFDPPVWVSRVWGPDAPKAECVRGAGTAVACGYHCQAGGGQVACAQTPGGVCSGTHQPLGCFDPPPAVFGVFGTDAPAPSCVSRGPKLVCGYHCRVSSTEALGCSATPFGTCVDNGGQVTCIDPDPYVICAKGRATPSPECVLRNGEWTCGYHCTTKAVELACAKTPDGVCDTQGPGRPVCFDPVVRRGATKCTELIGLQ